MASSRVGGGIAGTAEAESKGRKQPSVIVRHAVGMDKHVSSRKIASAKLATLSSRIKNPCDRILAGVQWEGDRISQLLVVPVLSDAGSVSSSQRQPVMLMTHQARPPVLWVLTGFRCRRQTVVAPHHLIRHRSQMPFGTAPWLGSGHLRSWNSPTLWVGPGAAGHRADVSSP